MNALSEYIGSTKQDTDKTKNFNSLFKLYLNKFTLTNRDYNSAQLFTY